MDTKNVTIATLGITGVVLFCTLVLLTCWQGSQAFARGMNDRGGDYIMATQLVDQGTEVVVILDATERRLGLYRLDSATGQLIPMRGLELDDRLFGVSTPREQQPRGGRGRPRRGREGRR